MSDDANDTSGLLDRLRSKDPIARNALVTRSYRRFRRLAARMFKSFPGIRRWREMDDVMQAAAVRLLKALNKNPPRSTSHYYNLLALQIRRELLDLIDKFQSPNSMEGNHQSDPSGGALLRVPNRSSEPLSLAEWKGFYLKASKLPEDQRAVVELLFIHGLTQERAAEVLGISLSTLKRLWLAARLVLGRFLDDPTHPMDS